MVDGCECARHKSAIQAFHGTTMMFSARSKELMSDTGVAGVVSKGLIPELATAVTAKDAGGGGGPGFQVPAEMVIIAQSDGGIFSTLGKTPNVVREVVSKESHCVVTTSGRGVADSEITQSNLHGPGGTGPGEGSANALGLPENTAGALGGPGGRVIKCNVTIREEPLTDRGASMHKASMKKGLREW